MAAIIMQAIILNAAFERNLVNRLYSETISFRKMMAIAIRMKNLSVFVAALRIGWPVL